MQEVAEFMKKEENHIKTSLVTVKSETLSDRDAGFCSGEETDLDLEYQCLTETSRDSVDSRSFLRGSRVKQKLLNPKRKSESDDLDVEPSFGKKIKVESGLDSLSSAGSIKRDPSPLSLVKEEIRRSSPFRPWDVDRPSSRDYFFPPHTYPPCVQDEPLSLVVEKKKSSSPDCCRTSSSQSPRCESVNSSHENFMFHSHRTSQPTSYDIVPVYEPQKCATLSKLPPSSNCSRLSCSPSTTSPEDKRHSSQSGSHQRNYKNMTRERRIEANARERTRVHTISAAFDSLRKCVPAYANNQKLSKLSVLRIACSYIMTLSRIAGYDYSEDQSAPSIEECIESVCNTIQLEGKTRKKKDE